MKRKSALCVATKVAGLSACSDTRLANAIPPKFQHPRVGAHCQGLGPAIEVLASQCKPEDVIVQLHAAESLCRQHFTHRSLHLFLSVLADCSPHAPEGHVVEVLHVMATSMHTCAQRLFSCVQQSCMKCVPGPLGNFGFAGARVLRHKEPKLPFFCFCL